MLASSLDPTQASDGYSGVHHLDAHLLNAVEDLFLMAGKTDSDSP